MIKVWSDAAEARLLERIGAAIADTSRELQAYIKAHGEFIETGKRMLPTSHYLFSIHGA